MALKEAITRLKQEGRKFVKGTGRFTRELDQALPGKHTRVLYDRLSRGQVAVFSQLRTGKNRLKYYLAKERVIESGECECERESETVSHFRLRCPRWSDERAQMFKAMEKRTGDLSLLLEGWDPRTCPNRERWQPDRAAVGAAIQFVRDTGRFEEEAPERP